MYRLDKICIIHMYYMYYVLSYVLSYVSYVLCIICIICITRKAPYSQENRKIWAVFPIQPENFRAVPVEKLRFFRFRFFLVHLENMPAVTPVFSGYPVPVEPENWVPCSKYSQNMCKKQYKFLENVIYDYILLSMMGCCGSAMFNLSVQYGIELTYPIPVPILGKMVFLFQLE